MRVRDAAGIYVHVPFCTVRCPFCSFAVTVRIDRTALWRDAVLREIELRAADWPHAVDTIYFGGGTPSLAPPEDLAAVIDALRARFRFARAPEISLEALPGTLDPAAMRTLRAAGVGRLSIGAQSFDDEELRVLGRDHDAAASIRTLECARSAGFESISLDLLYAVPGRPPESAVALVDAAAALRPDHVSPYALTIEPGSVYGARTARERLPVVVEDEVARQFHAVRERLHAHGLRQYESSSFARAPRHRSRHNRKYWEGRPYVGLGPGAHGFDGRTRWSNLPSLVRYAADIDAGRLPVATSELLAADQRRLERLFLGLRTTRGVLRVGPHATELADEPLRELEADGLVTACPRRMRPTPEGMAVAESLALSLA